MIYFTPIIRLLLVVYNVCCKHLCAYILSAFLHDFLGRKFQEWIKSYKHSGYLRRYHPVTFLVVYAT